MRICVITGGTGGIGLHLCEGFQRAGYAVTALDVEQHKALPDGIGFIQTDLRQAEAVSEAFRRVTERHGRRPCTRQQRGPRPFPQARHGNDRRRIRQRPFRKPARRVPVRAGLHQGQRGAGLRAHHQYRLHPAGTRTKRDGRPTALQKGALSPSRTRWPSPCAPHRSRSTP